MAELTNSITFVVGTTASGKSDYALKEALAHNGVVVNGDSLQVYVGMDIGTAKPTREERSLCPHYLFDVVKEGGTFTAGEYRRLALEVIEREIVKHNIYVVGGSGFYLQALEKGMFEVPPVDPRIIINLEQVLKEEGSEKLWDLLKEADSEAAKRIHSNDSYRLIRALSVMRQTGQTWTSLQSQTHDQALSRRFNVKKVGLHREKDELRTRLVERTKKMLETGWIDEVERLVQQAGDEWAPLQSVGYREVLEYLRGRLKKEALQDEIVQSSLQLAKKQRTWFKRDPDVEWLKFD